ncbi:hypothetical protein MKX01_002322 [Papaver californicum]|nr:hypothetical protein MKX01_002322 [Papaver californicum]
MSWHTDPELFMYYWNPSYGYGIGRIKKKYNDYLQHGDITYEEGQLNFSRHLCLGNNKETDYAALKNILATNADVISFENVMYVNCQGLVVHCSYKTYASGRWSYIPGITPFDALLAGEKNADLVAENSILKEQLNQEKNAKQALQKQVLDLTTKLQEPRCTTGSGSANVQPWLSGDTTVLSHWVPLEELDVLNFPRSTTPVTIMEGPNSCFWTQVEELTSIVNSLPGITNTSAETVVLAEEQALEKTNSELVAENSSLKEQLNQEKNDKQALQTQVLDLTAKLQESLSAGSGSVGVEL